MKRFFIIANLLMVIFGVTGCTPPVEKTLSDEEALSTLSEKELLKTALSEYHAHPAIISHLTHLPYETQQTFSKETQSAFLLFTSLDNLYHDQLNEAWQHFSNINRDDLDPQWYSLYQSIDQQLTLNLNTCPKGMVQPKDQWMYLLNRQFSKNCQGISDYESVSLKRILNTSDKAQWLNTLKRWHDAHPMHWTEQFVDWEGLIHAPASPKTIAVIIPLSGPDQSIGTSIKAGILAVAEKEVTVQFYDSYPDVKTAYDTASSVADAIIGPIHADDIKQISSLKKPTLILDDATTSDLLLSALPLHVTQSKAIIHSMKHHGHKQLLWITDRQHRQEVAQWPTSIKAHIPLPIQHQSNDDHAVNGFDGIVVLGDQPSDLASLSHLIDRQATMYLRPTVPIPPAFRDQSIIMHSHWYTHQTPHGWAPFFSEMTHVSPLKTDWYFALGMDAYFISRYDNVLRHFKNTPVEMASGVRMFHQQQWDQHLNLYLANQGKWLHMVDIFEKI